MAPPIDEETKRKMGIIPSKVISDPSQLPVIMRQFGEYVKGGGWKGMGKKIPTGMDFKGMGKDEIPTGLGGVADLVRSGTERPWDIGGREYLPRGMEKFQGPLSEAVRGREVLPKPGIPKWAQQAGGFVSSVRDTKWPTAMTEADVDPGRTKTREVYAPDRVPSDFTAERAGTPATGVPSLPSHGKFDWTGVKRDIAMLTEDARRRFDEQVGGRELPFATPEGREATSPEEYMGYARPGEAQEGGPPSIWADKGLYAKDAATPEELMGDADARYRPGMTGEQIGAAPPYQEETLPGLGKTPGGFVPGGQLTAEEVKREPKMRQLEVGPPTDISPTKPTAAKEKSTAGGSVGKGEKVLSDNYQESGRKMIRDRSGNVRIETKPEDLVHIISGTQVRVQNTVTGMVYNSDQAAMGGYAPKMSDREQEKIKSETDIITQQIASNAAKWIAKNKTFSGGNPFEFLKGAEDMNGNITYLVGDKRTGKIGGLQGATLDTLLQAAQPMLEAGDAEGLADILMGLDAAGKIDEAREMARSIYGTNPKIVEEAADIWDRKKKK